MKTRSAHLGLNEDASLDARNDGAVELRHVRGAGKLVLVFGELEWHVEQRQRDTTMEDIPS